MSDPITLAAASKYLDLMKQQYELDHYRMSRRQLWGEIREPATYSAHINLWVDWWPWRVWGRIVEWKPVVRTRVRDAWNVLLHGLPEWD